MNECGRESNARHPACEASDIGTTNTLMVFYGHVDVQ